VDACVDGWVFVRQGSLVDDDGSRSAVTKPVSRAAADAQPGRLRRRRAIVQRRYTEKLPRTVRRTMRGIPAGGLSTLDRPVSTHTLLVACPLYVTHVSVQRWFLSKKKTGKAKKCLGGYSGDNKVRYKRIGLSKSSLLI